MESAGHRTAAVSRETHLGRNWG